MNKLKNKNIYRIVCNSDELENIVLTQLKGHVFHVTSLKGYRGIKKDKKITNNRTGRFSFSYPQSETSYGRKKSYVCLFDLRNIEDEIIKEELYKFYFLNPVSANNRPIFGSVKHFV